MLSPRWWRIVTYGSEYEDGTVSQGGYSSHVRAHEYFTFPIPDDMESATVAPLMCAGLTVFSPLYRAKIGPGMKVAVLGMYVVYSLLTYASTIRSFSAR